jgi:LmbE family N-acetylglucosaminyl deacetylase
MSAVSRLFWGFALVLIRVTPNAVPVAVGGVFPLTIAFWPKPRHGFVLALHSSEASIVDVSPRISGHAGCSPLTVTVAAHKIGSAEVMVAVSPTARFGPIVQKIVCRIATVFGLGNARSYLTVGCSPILVVAPHPDDEALMASGIIAHALDSGQPAKVILITNGDHRKGNMRYGLKRQTESVEAMRKLGLQNTDVVFLGYPGDVVGLLRIMNNYLATDAAYTSAVGASTTYGANGLGRRDFHSWLTGKPAEYNAPNLQGDLETLIRAWRPIHIYTTSRFDEHPDHRAVYYFVARVVQCVRLADPSYTPTLHTTIIHDITSEPYEDFWGYDQLPPTRTVNFSGDDFWPLPANSADNPESVRFDASRCFNEPPNLLRTGLRWSEVESLPVPPPMRATSAAQNLKYQVLTSYASQQLRYLAPFCKRDEIFWTEHPPASELLAFPPAQQNVKKGGAAVLALTLVKPASAPRALTLASSDESVAVVPPAVIVPTGAVTALFAVKGVAAGTATVSANLDEQRIIAKITVTDTNNGTFKGRANG